MKPELTALLEDAARQCDHQADSETVLGDPDGYAATYRELAASARSLKWWVARRLFQVAAEAELAAAGKPGDPYPRTGT